MFPFVKEQNLFSYAHQTCVSLILNLMNKDEKRKLFEEHLHSQQQHRKHLNGEKQMQDEHKKNPEEDMLFIQKEFRSKFQEMQSLVSQYKAKEIAFSTVQEYYGKIKAYYLEINYVLKTYDRQSYKEALQKINTSLIDLKMKNEPKRVFRFTRRNEDFGVKEATQHKVNAEKVIADDNIPGLTHKKKQTIVVKEGWKTIGSYKITHCEQTSIDLLEKTEILFLKNLRNCRIRCAATKSTVFVDTCSQCTFELNCHQLRIHNTTDTTFGIFVTSKAIIEDCNSVKFKPYSFEYDAREGDQISLERKGKENLWRDIQDFNWLKDNQKSPHYELVQK